MLQSGANVMGTRTSISDFNCVPIGSTQGKGRLLGFFKDHVTTFEGEVKFMVN